MHVFVAAFAPLGSILEANVAHGRLKVFRAVATDAGRGAVCPDEGERRGRVVESGNLLPRPGRMARLAPCGRAIWSPGGHPLSELVLVGIHVAARAG